MKGLPQAGLELNKTTIISSDEALVLERAPKTMAIVGAGAVVESEVPVYAIVAGNPARIVGWARPQQ